LIIVFFHIPKTAGSSINVVVQSSLSRAYTIVVEDTQNERLSARLQRLAKRPEAFFIQGHITPSPDMFSIPMKRVTVLREPFDRLISHFCYCFDRRFYDLHQLEFFRSRKNYSRGYFDGEDIIEWIAHFRTDDFQVRFLSGEYNEKVTDECLTRAIATLSNFDYVAATDNLEEFLKVLGYFMRRNLSVDKMPHTNKSDKRGLRISSEERDFISKNYCQKDDKLLQAFMSRKAQMDESLLHTFSGKIDDRESWEARRILKAFSLNKTMYEVLFKIKRKSLGIAIQSVEAMGNLLSGG
jgi:hypothetical protein